MAKLLVLLACFGLSSAMVLDNRRLGDSNQVTQSTWNHRTDLIHRIHDTCRKCIVDRNHVDCNTCLRMTSRDILLGLGDNCMTCIQQQSGRDCDMCLDQIGRDQLVGNTDDIQRGTLQHNTGLYGLNLECRQCIDRGTVTDCLNCLMRTDSSTLQGLPRDCILCIRHRADGNCGVCRSMMGVNNRGERLMYDTRMDLNTVRDLPTTTIDDDRLLHVNRKKIVQLNGEDRLDNKRIDDNSNMRGHLMIILQGRGIDDARKTKLRDDNDVGLHTGRDLGLMDITDVLNRLDGTCRRCITDRNVGDCNKCLTITKHDDLKRLGDECLTCIRHQTVNDCNMCLDCMNRDRIIDRGVIDHNTNMRGGLTMHNTGLHRLNVDCLRCIDRRLATDCNTCLMHTDIMLLNDLPRVCVQCIHHRIDGDCNMCKNMVDTNRRGDMIHRELSENLNLVKDLPTTTINDDRLLHVNRKKINALSGLDRTTDNVDNKRTLFMNTIRGHGIDNGQKIKLTNDVDEGLNADCMRCIDRRTVTDCDTCLTGTDIDLIRNIPRECKMCIRNRIDGNCDMCKTMLGTVRKWDEMHKMNGMWHNTNTKLNDVDVVERLDDNRSMGDRLLHGRGINDGRRTMLRDDIDLDVHKGSDIGVMGRGMVDRMDLLNHLDGTCRRCITDRNSVDCNRCRMLTNMEDLMRLGDHCLTCVQRQNIMDCNMCKERVIHGRLVDDDDDDDMMRRDWMVRDTGLHGWLDNDNIRRDWTIRNAGLHGMSGNDNMRRDWLIRDNDNMERDWLVRDKDSMRRDWLLRGDRGLMTHDIDVDRRGDVLHRGWNGMLHDTTFRDLPTTTIDNERLLHVNRKKLNALTHGIDNLSVSGDLNIRDRFLNVLHGRRIDDGRKIVDDMNIMGRGDLDRGMDKWGQRDVGLLERLDGICRRCIVDRNTIDCNRCLSVTSMDILMRLGDSCLTCIRHQGDLDCNMCMDHIRMIGGDNMRRDWTLRDDDTMRRDWLVRDTGLRGSMDNDRDWLIRDDVNLRRGSSVHDIGLRNLNTNCLRCIHHRTLTDCNTCRMTLGDDILKTLQKDCVKCINKMEAEKCDKCLNVLGERF